MLRIELESNEFSKKVSYILAILLVIFFLTAIISKIFDYNLTEILLPSYQCSFLESTGLYCPGCGGTRSFSYLLHGNIIESFIHHPSVPFLFFTSIVFVLSHVLNRITKGRTKPFNIRPVYFYVFIGISIVQFLVKNIILVTSGHHLI